MSPQWDLFAGGKLPRFLGKAIHFVSKQDAKRFTVARFLVCYEPTVVPLSVKAK